MISRRQKGKIIDKRERKKGEIITKDKTNLCFLLDMAVKNSLLFQLIRDRIYSNTKKKKKENNFFKNQNNQQIFHEKWKRKGKEMTRLSQPLSLKF